MSKGKFKETEGEGEEWRKGGERGRDEQEEIWKVAFWNVVGVGNKDREFWQRIKEWDVIVLSETWIEEKGWGKLKERYY